MNRSSARGLRVAGVALGMMAVLAAPPATAVDALPAGTQNTSPVGTWSGTVEHAEGSGDLTLSFHPGGVVCLSSGGGADGGGAGRGNWWSIRGNSFDYRVTERLYDGAGTTVGYVRVNQTASQHGRSIRSQGISTILDADGTFLQEAPAKVRVTRVSSTPVPC